MSVPLVALGLRSLDTATPLNRMLQFNMQKQQMDRLDQREAKDDQFRALQLAIQNKRLDRMDKKEAYELVGRAASRADTPELWSKTIGVFEGMGYDVSAYRDFSARDTVLSSVQQELMAVPEGGTIIDKRTGQTVAQGQPKPETFGQPVAGIGPDGKPVFQQFGQRGSTRPVDGFQPLPRTGMEVTTPDGTTVRMGGEPAGSGLAKPTINKVEENLFGATERLGRIARITDSYKPEYQQLGTRFSALTTAFKEKAGFTPDPADKALLEDFSVYKRRAAEDLTMTLKEMSGAAVTPQEADRLLRAIPNPGSGLLDGDSPSEFKAKLDDLNRDVKRAVARLSYIRQNGFDAKMMGQIPLDRMPRLMNQRAGQLEQQFKAQGKSGDELDMLVRASLAQEFGLAGP